MINRFLITSLLITNTAIADPIFNDGNIAIAAEDIDISEIQNLQNPNSSGILGDLKNDVFFISGLLQKKYPASFIVSETNDEKTLKDIILNFFRTNPKEKQEVDECVDALNKDLFLLKDPQPATYYYKEIKPGEYEAALFPTDAKELNNLFTHTSTLVGFSKTNRYGSLNFLPLSVKINKENFNFHIFHGKQRVTYRKLSTGYVPVVIGFGVHIVGNGRSKTNNLDLSGLQGLKTAASSNRVSGYSQAAHIGITLPNSLTKVVPSPSLSLSPDFEKQMKEIQKIVEAIDLGEQVVDKADLKLEPYYIAMGNSRINPQCLVFN